MEHIAQILEEIRQDVKRLNETSLNQAQYDLLLKDLEDLKWREKTFSKIINFFKNIAIIAAGVTIFTQLIHFYHTYMGPKP